VIPLPIETERLRLRAWTREDEPTLSALYTDPEVMRYISLGDATVPGLLERYRRDQTEHGFAFWALCTKEGTVVGNVGFHVLGPTGGPELGWALAQEAWGHGYATEAAQACINALFAHTRHDRIVALVDPDNERSLRTAGRIGMRRVEEIHHRGQRHVLFEVTRA
jgi:[ribosomal protein S5]-alanine N-acetyltransferase